MKHSLKFTTKLFLGLALLLISAKSFCQTTGDEIIGTWWNQEKDGKIEIYKSDNTYAGKLIWIKEPNDTTTGKPLLDKKNPDEKLRGKPILGSNLMYGFVFNKEDKEWIDGKIYNGREGDTYKCYIELNSDKTLKVRGYIGASWMGLGKTNTWTRIK